MKNGHTAELPLADAPPFEPGTVGTLIQNGGGEQLLIPEADLLKVDAIAAAMRQEDAERQEVFEWSKDDSVLLAEQPATAVYRNMFNSVVIRQERRWNEDEDTVITIADSNLQAFIDKLCDLAGIGSGGCVGSIGRCD